MNKIVIVILIILGLGLIAYNVTLVDFKDPFQGNSIIALIGILASLCAIALLLIYSTSKKIQKKFEQED